MESSNQFLDLENYNRTDTETQAILRYTGSNFLDSQTKVWVYKFTLNSNNFPLYVPNIIDTFVPYNIDDNTEVEIDSSIDYYMMDWAVTVSYANQSKTTPVLWEKGGIKQVRSPSLLNNKYFWLRNSDEICNWVSEAFARIMGFNMIFLTKNADKWSLLVNTSAQVNAIYFNDAMKEFFSFNYGELNVITIPPLQTYTVFSQDFYVVTTSTTNNKLFLFDKIIFKSDQLNVPQLNLQNFDDNSPNYSNSTILSYDLNIVDISEIGNSITYTSDCKDRSLSLLSPNIPREMSVIPYFITRKGETFIINLSKGEKISFSMMFF